MYCSVVTLLSLVIPLFFLMLHFIAHVLRQLTQLLHVLANTYTGCLVRSLDYDLV